MAWNFTGRVPGWCAERLPWARPALFEDQPERAEGAQDRCEVGEGVEVHERVIRRSQCSQKGKGEHREPVTRTELLVVGPAFIAGGGTGRIGRCQRASPVGRNPTLRSN